MLRRLLTLTLAAFLIVPSASFAASATQNGYDEVEVKPATSTGSNDEPASKPAATETAQAAPATAASSNLPFTGLEAGLIAAAGAGLIGTGFAMRRATREQ